ncbi:MAG: class I SAM-dependent methyltransferase [Terriglobales bacterium]
MLNMRLLLKLGGIAATSRSTRVFYDRISPFYELLFTDHLSHIRTMVAVMGEEFPHGIKVLDIACGTGALSRRLEERGFCVTGVDFSFQSLRRLKQATNSIRVIQADAATLPFGSASFDVVTCMGAWRHFPVPEVVLHEICRVLRRDGIFFVGYFPPKLGGLLSVPRGPLGEAIVFFYGCVMRLLKYNDRTDPEMESQTLQMIELAFTKYRRIQSGKEAEYLIVADSPRLGLELR